ncbi:MAG: response regulator [Bacteroidetes bacterium]|nr:response regulator [Bacteroidota bacterium]
MASNYFLKIINLLIFLLLFLPFSAFPQKFNFNIYDSDKGLASNLTKKVVKDRQGLIWIATDGGLVFFDGIRFRTIIEDLPSHYVKDIFLSGDNSLYCITDMGIGIINENKKFELIWPGSETDSDTTAAYPKSMFQDFSGTLWISEKTGISRVAGSKLKKYKFDLQFHTDSYNRSFLYAEDKYRRLIVSSWKGGLFYLDKQSDTFILLPFFRDNPRPEINALSILPDSTFLIGTSIGLFQFIPQANIISSKLIKLNNLSQISSIAINRYGTLYLGTFQNGLYRMKLNNLKNPVKVNDYPFSNISSITIDDENMIWSSTDDGIVAAYETFFDWSELNNKKLFIRNVKNFNDGRLLVCDQEGIYFVENLNERVSVTTAIKTGNKSIYDIETNAGIIWVSYRDGSLERHQNNAVTKIPLPETAYRFNTLTIDKRNRLWAHGEGDNRIYRIDSTSNIEAYGTEKGVLPTINFVLSGNDDQLFYSAGKRKSTLHQYDQKENCFKPVEFKLAIGTPDPEFIRVIIKADSLRYWIGASNGLFLLENGNLTQERAVNEFGIPDIKALGFDRFGQLWIGCETGIICLQGKKASYFSKTDGLSNTTITHKAIAFDKNSRLWVGSAKGLAFWQGRIEPLGTTATPRLSTIRFGNDELLPNLPGDPELKTETPFTAGFYSVTYPAEFIQFQSRLVGYQSEWSAPSSQKLVQFPGLSIGTYTFQIRAIKSGHFWSEPEEFTFTVIPPWYSSPLLIVVYFVTLTGLIFFLVAGIQKRRFNLLTQRQITLEKLIEERTLSLVTEKEKTEQALNETEKARNEAEIQREIAQSAMESLTLHEQKLVEMDQAKTRFFANISHEFRTPLTLTIGPVESALEGKFGSVGPQMKHQLEIVLRNSRRLLRLINQLLEISRIDSGQFRISVQEQNIVVFVKEIYELFHPWSVEKHIRYDFISSERTLFGLIDMDKVEKILSNLLSNSFKFTPEGGRVSIKLKKVSHPETGAPLAEFSVSDTGTGIKPEDLPHIFERFFHSDHNLPGGQNSTGIGLSLVKDLIHYHHGEIHVKSELNRGSEFTFWIPVSAESYATDEIRDEEPERIQAFIDRAKTELMELSDNIELSDFNFLPAGSPKTFTVLIIDDNRDIRSYVRAILEEQYQVIEAENGQDGLEKAEKTPPTLVIADIMMPVMDGYEFIRRIRVHEKLKHLPVILLTAKASGDMKAEGLEIGADDYMFKPFYTKELLARVKNLIQLRQQENQLRKMNHELESVVDALKKADSLKSKLLSIAAHDLRNPLHSIIGYVELIESRLPENSELNPKLNKISKSADRMLSSIKELLDSSVVDNEALSMNIVPVNLKELITQVISQNEPMATRKEQVVDFKMDSFSESPVHGDEDKLRKMVDNLLSNAIKYSPPGKKISILLAGDEKSVRIEVEDEGPGLTEDDKLKMFRRFQRLSAQPTGGEISTGLGLSIVKEFAELHHGTITVESLPGAGATFIVELPRNSL